MKIALVHDYLNEFGGAEVVLSALHEVFPKAPIYVSILDKKGLGDFWKKFTDADIKTSWFNYFPFAAKLISPLRFLIPLIWSSFDFSGYDVVITSASWAVTKGMKKGKKTIEICYCHTPPRYLYGYDTSRNWSNKWFSGFVSLYAIIVNHFMRMYDFNQAQKVDFFVANSENTGQRIKKFYRKSFTVIYPPVDIEKIINSSIKRVEGKYYLTGGRMVASKNFDLVIRACKKAKANLKIFGTGIEEKHLKKISDSNVEFLGKVSEEELIAYYKGAQGFVLAQRDEDFGITPIESMAAGTPVIAFRGGGYIESVVEGKTGIFFNEPTVESLILAIKKLDNIKINPEDCIKQAKKFSKERFKREIEKFVVNKLLSKKLK